MVCLAAPSSLTPESLPPALEHCLGGSVGFDQFEGLATLALRNEARFGSLALRLGHSLGRALARRVAPFATGFATCLMFNLHGKHLSFC